MTNLARRKFIYAGASVAAAAGLGYLTKDYWLPSSEITKTSPTATKIISQSKQTTFTITTATSTTELPTPSRLVDLDLLLFHDFFADGTKSDEDPGIDDAILNVRSDNGNLILENVQANVDGIYRLNGLKENDNYFIELSGKIAEEFLYFSLPDGNFKPIERYYNISADSSKELIQIGLLVGPFTLPFKKGTKYHFRDWSFSNLESDGLRDWKGEKQTYPGHVDTDFYMEEGTPIIAVAPGTVYETHHWDPSDSNPDTRYGGSHIIIDHGYDIYSGYWHLKSISVSLGQKVARGEEIGLCGHTGYFRWGSQSESLMPESWSHLALTATAPASKYPRLPGFGYCCTDTWRDITNPFSKSLWTKDNDPQYPIPS